MKKLIVSTFFMVGSFFTITAYAVTGTQVGTSGKTYASSEIQCGLNPTAGWSPFVQAGLYNPKKGSAATVSLNGTGVATVNFVSPDAQVWLANQTNTVVVDINSRTQDSYTFTSNQANICIPDTSQNAVDKANGLEYAASLKSTATLTPGCAFNSATGRAQPYINFFDGDLATSPITYYLLNVSVNNVPLTQLNSTHRQTPIFLSPGLNVISAANGSVSIDYYVRDGGTGSCTLP